MMSTSSSIFSKLGNDRFGGHKNSMSPFDKDKAYYSTIKTEENKMVQRSQRKPFALRRNTMASKTQTTWSALDYN